MAKKSKARSAQPESDVRRVAENRRARHAYHVLEELECGIELRGTEVKSLREGKASIAEAFAMVRRGELWLLGSHIPEYGHGTAFNHVPTRPRRLLVHRRELRAWEKAARERGVTMVPLELYFRRHLVKLRLGLVRGKKLHDKREVERERTDRREIDRAMARRR